MAGETIFLIHDREVLTRKLNHALELDGYTVQSISDYNEIKKLMVQVMPHLIILEVSSTIEDIQEFKDVVERTASLQNIPVIAVLESIDRMEAVLLARMGVFEILVSPLDKDKLLQTVHKAISRMKKDGEFRLVEGESQDGFRTIEFLSHLDASNSKNIENYVDHLIIDRDIQKMEFDFKQVRYIDSSGIGVLIVCMKKLELLGGALRLINVNEQVYTLLKTLHIDTILGLDKEIA